MSHNYSLRLSSGGHMPIVGLGTWKSTGGDVKSAVKVAVECGYRHIDTAFVYGNEKEVGDAIKEKIEDGTVKREDLFVVTKLWTTYHRKDLVLPILKEQLASLSLQFIDLYLIHWPIAFKEGDELFPQDENKVQLFSDACFIDTWKEMEKAVEMGLTKSIGLSNFNSKQIQQILDVCSIKPSNLQVECHPYFPNTKLLNFCKEKGIVFTAYSPLGSSDRPWAKEGEKKLVDEEKVKEIAKKHAKTPGQVILRYNVQRGVVVIPKSVTPSRIKENLDLFSFELTEDDMKAMETFPIERRLDLDWAQQLNKYYPFNEDF